jgi:mRNA-degrading endonuclease RelE of RelBE toxin-antitoxin system
MSILLHRTYKILILFDNKLIYYDEIKNNIEFLEKWIKDLKKELNKQYKIVFDRLELLKERGRGTEKLEGEIKIGESKIYLFSDRVNDDIRIIFSVFKETHTIVIWGIAHHEKAYGKIIQHAEGFIKSHQERILELLGIKVVHR